MTPDTSSQLSPQLQSIADQAHLLRGKAIGAYAQIEFLLADICSQSWERPEYRHLKAHIPFKTADRVKEIAQLFKSDGPLSAYWKDVEPLLAQLASFEKNRHLFAHGHLILTNSNGAPTVHFRLYQPSNGGIQLQTESWSLEHMASIASDIASYAGNFGRLLDRVNAEQTLK